MLINQYVCHTCGNDKLKEFSRYETCQNGTRQIFRCDNCHCVFSETKGTFLEGLRKPVSLIAQVLKNRSEGLGFNATCRAFDIAKNTLLEWERRFANLKDILLIYTLLHTFISQVIEGDELYTKVKKNLPVEECKGWTIVLMERASRFIWEMKCGKKDRTLFFWGIRMIRQVIERTEDLTLLTDGERRYGKILFEICHEIVRSGKRGRPPKVLRQGVKVRIKNKGSQRSKPGRKRPKYEAPQREHPQTVQDIADNSIHANHVEAFNASLRRRNSTYRRRTNTCAKSTGGLQRTLDIFRVVHNFIRIHFTTKQVPAVALGVLDEGLAWEDAFKIQQGYSYV